MAGPTIEMSMRLSLAPLMRVPREALVWKGIAPFRDHDGRPFGVGLQVERQGGGASVTLVHRGRLFGQRTDGGMQSYTIPLEAIPQRFGGVRWWWRCPITGRRAAALFLPLGALRFASREAYHLAYATQRMSPGERARTRLRRGYARLAAGDYEGDLLDGPPDKRPWMRWATYDRRCERLAPQAERIGEDFMRSMARCRLLRVL